MKDVYGCRVLGVVDCYLTCNDAIWLLAFKKDWVLVESLDLSHNKVGYVAETFFEWFRKEIRGLVKVKELIFVDNNFPKDSKLLYDFIEKCVQ